MIEFLANSCQPAESDRPYVPLVAIFQCDNTSSLVETGVCARS